MSFLYNISIVKKISIIISMSILGLIIVGWIGIKNSNGGYDALVYVQQEIKKADDIKELRAKIQGIQTSYTSLLSQFAAYEGVAIEVNKDIKYIDKTIAQQDSVFVSKKEREVYKLLSTNWIKAKPMLKKIEIAISDEDDDAIRSVIENKWILVYFNMMKEVNKLYAMTSKKVQQNTATQQNILAKNTKIIYVLLPITILVVLFFSILVSNTITKPLRYISKNLKDNDGNDLTIRFNIDSKDEIGIIAQNFNAFFEHLGSVFVSIKDAAVNNSNIASKTQNVSSDIGKRSKEEQILVEASSEKGQTVKNSLEVSLEGAEKSNGYTVKANQKLNTVKEEILGLVNNINNASKLEYELASRLSNLSEDTQQVKNVLTVISDIADQTNLLALNAAIEAARAGEHGRGFAVVADEVRNLAERTQKSLVEIDSTISVIVQSIVEASSAMNKNSDSMSNLSDKSHEIEQEVTSVSEMMYQASDNSSSSLEGFKSLFEIATELITEIEKINQISNENTNSIEKVVDFMNELGSSSKELESDITKFKT